MEAVRCLEEGIIQRPRDGDIGAVFGFGYPPLRGGPFSHLDARGLRSIVGRMKSFQDRLGPAYVVPRLLEELAAAGKSFADMDGEQ